MIVGGGGSTRKLLGISDCNINTIVFLLVSISYYFIDYESYRPMITATQLITFDPSQLRNADGSTGQSTLPDTVHR